MAGAWVGNGLLTVIAFVLAFTQQDRLTPVTFLAVAFTILAGNLLPLAVYVIELLYHQAEVKGEHARAGDTLRKSVAHMDKVEARLQETAESASKSILIARQVPDRIEERLKGFQAFMELAQEGGLDETLRKLGAGGKGGVSREEFKALEAKLDAILRRLEQSPVTAASVPAPAEPAPKPATPASTPAETPAAKTENKPRRLGRGLDRLISKGVTISPKGKGTAAEKPKAPAQPEPPAVKPVAETPPPAEPASAVEPPQPEPTAADELDEVESPIARKPSPAEAVPPVEPEPEPVTEPEAEEAEAQAEADQNWLDPEELAQLEDEFAAEVSVDEDAEAETKPADETEQELSEEEKLASDVQATLLFEDDELDWDDDDLDVSHGRETPPAATPAAKEPEAPVESAPETPAPEAPPEQPTAEKKKSVLVVRSMVGDNHLLTLRGEQAPLDPNDGLILDMTGIGEYRWEVDLSEPLHFRVYLDDEKPANGDELVLEPGKTLRVMPRFPRD